MGDKIRVQLFIYQRVNLHFPMVFLWFSHFPMVFQWGRSELVIIHPEEYTPPTHPPPHAAACGASAPAAGGLEASRQGHRGWARLTSGKHSQTSMEGFFMGKS